MIHGDDTRRATQCRAAATQQQLVSAAIQRAAACIEQLRPRLQGFVISVKSADIALAIRLLKAAKLLSAAT